MKDHERQIVELFVAPRRRERLAFLLGTPKRRDRGLHEFHTSDVFAPDCLVEIPPNQQFAEPICELMRGMGAGDRCHVLSADDAIDGAELPLSEALSRVVGFCVETVLLCPTGKVGYFEGGHAKDRYILRAGRHAA